MNSERQLIVLREPHTSEKSTLLADKYKQFTFKVMKTSTKQEIKISVAKLFNVKVRNVTIVNVKGKSKRYKQLQGKRNDWKKAYVTLYADYDIDFTMVE